MKDKILEMFYEEDPALEVIKEGSWIDDGKYSHRATVVKLDDTFYQISEYRAGSYYTDYEYVDASVHVVVPKEVTKVVYEAVKQI